MKKSCPVTWRKVGPKINPVINRLFGPRFLARDGAAMRTQDAEVIKNDRDFAVGLLSRAICQIRSEHHSRGRTFYLARGPAVANHCRKSSLE